MAALKWGRIADYDDGFAHGQRAGHNWVSHPHRGANEINGRSYWLLYQYPLDPSDWLRGVLDGQRNVLDSHPTRVKLELDHAT